MDDEAPPRNASPPGKNDTDVTANTLSSEYYRQKSTLGSSAAEGWNELEVLQSFRDTFGAQLSTPHGFLTLAECYWELASREGDQQSDANQRKDALKYCPRRARESIALKEAAELLAGLVFEQPRNGYAHELFAAVCDRSGDQKTALLEYALACATLPPDHDANWIRLEDLAQQLPETEVIELLEKVTADYPAHRQLKLLLGGAYKRARQPQKAETCLRDALMQMDSVGLDQEKAAAQHLLATVLQDLGKTEEADAMIVSALPNLGWEPSFWSLLECGMFKGALEVCSRRIPSYDSWASGYRADREFVEGVFKMVWLLELKLRSLVGWSREKGKAHLLLARCYLHLGQQELADEEESKAEICFREEAAHGG